MSAPRPLPVLNQLTSPVSTQNFPVQPAFEIVQPFQSLGSAYLYQVNSILARALSTLPDADIGA